MRWKLAFHPLQSVKGNRQIARKKAEYRTPTLRPPATASPRPITRAAVPLSSDAADLPLVTALAVDSLSLPTCDTTTPKPTQSPDTDLRPRIPFSDLVTPAAAQQGAPDAPVNASAADTPPTELTNLPPRYPEVARRRGIEGYVIVRLLIGDQGEVQDTEILKVSGHAAFRQEVLRMADRWRFSAPSHEGRPIRVWAVKTIRFRLSG